MALRTHSHRHWFQLHDSYQTSVSASSTLASKFNWVLNQSRSVNASINDDNRCEQGLRGGILAKPKENSFRCGPKKHDGGYSQICVWDPLCCTVQAPSPVSKRSLLGLCRRQRSSWKKQQKKTSVDKCWRWRVVAKITKSGRCWSVRNEHTYVARGRVPLRNGGLPVVRVHRHVAVDVAVPPEGEVHHVAGV